MLKDKSIYTIDRIRKEYKEEELKELEEKHNEIFKKRLSDKVGVITEMLQNCFALHGLEVQSIGKSEEKKPIVKVDYTGKIEINPNVKVRKLRLRSEYAAANRINAQFDYHDIEFDGSSSAPVHRGTAAAFGKVATHIWKTEKLAAEMKAAIVMARWSGELILQSDKNEFRAINPMHFFPALNATNWKNGDVLIVAEPIAKYEALEFMSEDELKKEIDNADSLTCRFASILNPTKLMASIFYEKATKEERLLLGRLIDMEGQSMSSVSMFSTDFFNHFENDDASMLRVRVYDRTNKKLCTYLNDKLVNIEDWGENWDFPYDQVLEFTDGMTKVGMSDIGAMLPYGRFESNIMDLHKQQLERSAGLPTFIDRRFAETMRVSGDGTLAVFDRNTLGGSRNPEQSIFSPQIKYDLAQTNNLFGLVDQKLWQIGNVAPNQVGTVLNEYETAEAVKRSIGAVEATIRERNIRNQEELILPAMKRYLMYKLVWDKTNKAEDLVSGIRSSEGEPNRIILAKAAKVSDHGDWWLYTIDEDHQYFEDKMNKSLLITMLDEMENEQSPIVPGSGLSVGDVLESLGNSDLKTTDITPEVDEQTGDLIVLEKTPEPDERGVVKPKERWSTKLEQLRQRGIDGVIIPQEINKLGIGLELSAVVPTVDEKMMRAQFAVSMIAVTSQTNPLLSASLAMYACKQMGIDISRDFSIDVIKEGAQEKEMLQMQEQMAQVDAQNAQVNAQNASAQESAAMAVGAPPPEQLAQMGATSEAQGQLDNIMTGNNQGLPQ